MTPEDLRPITEDEKKVLDSVRFSRISIPIVMGLIVVGWLMWHNFNLEEFQKINWNHHVLTWVAIALLLYIIRHLFYAWRLRILSYQDFSWKKAIELIFIWEFSSAISPTSIGGSTVALFFIAQEKISSARTVSLVLYSIVLDTLFFIFSMPMLYFIIGPEVIRPGMASLNDIDGFGYTFIVVLFVMTIYGLLFFYGLFVNPVKIKRLLLAFSKIRFLRRFKKDLRKTAMDVVTSSREMANRSWGFHFNAVISTFGAWVTRFLAVNCIIIALVFGTPMDFWNQFLIYGRGATMYGLTAFSPTPGGAGVAEAIFGSFFSDFMPLGMAVLVALLWRIITYYPYIIIGLIIIPNWIKNVIKRRKMHKSTPQPT